MFSFDDVTVQKRYLKQAGLNQDAMFKNLTYEANEAWEAFDIEIESADGSIFRERTFGPNIDKVYPKDKYENNVKVGVETKEEAFKRVSKEISTKLFHLASCFMSPEDVKEGVKSCKDMKTFVTAINKMITGADTSKKINFLTIWKNSDAKRRSNLIIAEKIKWVEPTQHNADGTVKSANISLTKWQAANQMVEKYPYAANAGGDNSPILSDVKLPENANTSDLPF